ALFDTLVVDFKDRIGDHRHLLRSRNTTGKLAPQYRQTRGRWQTHDFMTDDQRSVGDGARFVHSLHPPIALYPHRRVSPSPRLPRPPSPRRPISGAGSAANGKYCSAPSATITSRFLPNCAATGPSRIWLRAVAHSGLCAAAPPARRASNWAPVSPAASSS